MRDLPELRREIIRISTALGPTIHALKPLSSEERAELEGALNGIVWAVSHAAKAPLDSALPTLLVERIDELAARRIAELSEKPAAETFVSTICDAGEHARCELANCACRVGIHGAFHGGA